MENGKRNKMLGGTCCHSAVGAAYFRKFPENDFKLRQKQHQRNMLLRRNLAAMGNENYRDAAPMALKKQAEQMSKSGMRNS